MAELEVTELKAHNGRPVTYGLEHIAPARLPFPVVTIERVILVSNHDTFILYLRHPLNELLGG